MVRARCRAVALSPPPPSVPGNVPLGAIAQLGERRVRNAEVRGSIPRCSTRFHDEKRERSLALVAALKASTGLGVATSERRRTFMCQRVGAFRPKPGDAAILWGAEMRLRDGACMGLRAGGLDPSGIALGLARSLGLPMPRLQAQCPEQSDRGRRRSVVRACLLRTCHVADTGAWFLIGLKGGRASEDSVEKGNTMLPKSTLPDGVGVATALVLSLAAPGVHASSNSLRYSYIPLDHETVPAPYVANNFSPSAILDGGIVVGTIYDATFTNEALAVWRNGTITIGPAGSGNTVNALGVIGGASPSNQAALFLGNTTTLIPRLPGETTASVVDLSLSGLALVQSINASYTQTYAYYLAGTETVIPFGLPDPVFGGHMNQWGQVAVTKEESATDHFTRGYRYDPLTKKTTPLLPYAGDPTDVLALAEGINNRGEVLGYSYTGSSAPSYHERIGVWNTAGVYQPYFYETIDTNALFFNDLDQIVITNPAFFGPGVGTELSRTASGNEARSRESGRQRALRPLPQ